MSDIQLIDLSDYVKEQTRIQGSHDQNGTDIDEWFSKQLRDTDIYYRSVDDDVRANRIMHTLYELEKRRNKMEEDYKNDLSHVKPDDSTATPVKVTKMMYIGPTKKYDNLKVGYTYYIVTDGENYNIYTNYDFSQFIEEEFVEDEWRELFEINL